MASKTNWLFAKLVCIGSGRVALLAQAPSSSYAFATPRRPIKPVPVPQRVSLASRTPVRSAPNPPPRDKTTVDIEKLLIWAYRDELSKRTTSSAEEIWGKIEEISRLGIAGQDTKRTPQRYDFGEPDQDAEKIEKAVSALQPVIVDWEESATALMGELAALLNTRDVLLVRSFSTAALIIKHAVMNSRPAWDETITMKDGEIKKFSGAPVPTWIRTPLGKPRPAVVGECRGKNLYSAGSYCPLKWEPSPTAIALARLDYAVWHRGLCQLAETLELERHIALPPSAPAAPWLGEREPPARIITVGERLSTPLPLHPRRKIAGPRKVEKKSSEVRKIGLEPGAPAGQASDRTKR